MLSVREKGGAKANVKGCRQLSEVSGQPVEGAAGHRGNLTTGERVQVGCIDIFGPASVLLQQLDSLRITLGLY